MAGGSVADSISRAGLNKDPDAVTAFIGNAKAAFKSSSAPAGA